MDISRQLLSDGPPSLVATTQQVYVSPWSSVKVAVVVLLSLVVLSTSSTPAKEGVHLTV